ncbi:MAG: signal recognition particle-docking protein FtsY [Thermaurantiacus tibetensis]|uniref:signal recognition particle-docking protein FtsY n=1 Tax=Thermaurantiacus tibetensis TaxID=2759035 RepID=UPI0018908832|nr:signal recognition particle-docking protein FtsY [Thermaurantiacus tibetensis]
MTEGGSTEVTGRGGFLARLRAGLQRTSAKLSESLTLLVGTRTLEPADLDALEETLIAADLGPAVAARITDRLREARVVGEVDLAGVKRIVVEEVTAILAPLARPLAVTAFPRPHVILVVGVNGTGKTTTIAKLGHLFQEEDYEVMFAAGDTFRAAAVEQLKVWGERLGVPVVAGAEGTDAAGLAYRAMEEAKASGRDVLLVDTAGRLQNKAGLMDELAKIRRVLAKQDPSAPHDVVLVLDATTGQNALSQIEVFREVAGVTGIVMTKLDGTARGGVLVAAAETFGLPIHAVGVGERLGDLRPFDPRAFARALVGEGA